MPGPPLGVLGAGGQPLDSAPKPSTEGSPGNVGQFSENCCLSPFLPISLWNMICL